MKNTDDVKENMITITTQLIQNSDGNIRQITTRAISEKANVGIGLINYHFKSKDNLIRICVQRIISGVVMGFNPGEKSYSNDLERLIDWAAQVFEFLFAHPAIARISILSDLENYTFNCNSVYTQKGFIKGLNSEVCQEDKVLLAFILTSAMQTAFLGSDTCKALMGVELNTPSGRAAFIARLVSALVEGLKQGERE